jgi:long-chain fatty acid transport protein
MEWMMKLKLKLSMLLVFLILLPFVGVQAGGLTFSGVGTKAIGMGGAFRGLADDWSASFWNPAGLAYLEQSELNISPYTTSPRPTYLPEVFFGQGENVYEVGFRNGAKWYPDDKNFLNSTFGAFLKLDQLKGYTLGFAFFTPYDVQYAWDVYDPPPGYNNSVSLPGYDYQTDLMVLDFHPTLAKEIIADKLSLGAGISILYGDLLLRKLSLVLTDSLIPRPYENFPMDSKFEGDGWGVGLNLGILFKLTPKVNLGVTVRSPVDITLSGITDLQVFLPDNDSLAQEIKEQALDQGLDSLFLGGSLKNSGNDEITLSLPADFGAGISYQYSEKLMFAFDVSWVNWAGLEELEAKFGWAYPFDGNPESVKIPLKWEDVIRFSAGCEYRLSEKVALRGGYYYEPSPVPDKSLTPLFPDIGDKNGISLGVSLKLHPIEIAYAYQYIDFKERSVKTLADINNDFRFDNLPGVYRMDSHASYFSLSYYF